MKKSVLLKSVLMASALSVNAARAADDSATVNGITFYGIVDVDLTYDTHGAPPPPAGTIGSNWGVQKTSNRPILEMGQSGMSQSRWGFRGAEDLGDGWTGLFRTEGAFNPLNGAITDAQRAITSNNGVPQAQQTAYGDSAINGQLFSRAAYVGISNPTYGTLTAGRNTTFENDAIAAYDPDGSSYAFSLIGFSGITAGAGRTQDTRWDNSLKYNGGYGPIRYGLMYQFGGTLARNDTGLGADLGFDWQGLSFDGVYTVKKDNISAAPLTLPQMLAAAAAGFSTQNAIAANVSDNAAFGLNVKYVWDRFKFYAGYEHVNYGNAKSPLPVGFVNVGNYIGAVVSNSAYQGDKLQVMWAGFRYEATPRLEAIVSWDHYIQNSYKGNGCSDSSFAQCSGTENTASLAVDYHFTKKFDVYAGAMYSQVLGGLENGFFHNNNVDPTIGMRYAW